MPAEQPRARYVSPLRYPGGKARMSQALAALFDAQVSDLGVEVWLEPFAGGAGAGLTLLQREQVEELWLVEKHPALAAMWRSIFDDGERFAARIRATEATLANWEHAHRVLEAHAGGEGVEDLELGLAALLINRCSRSGIVAPGVGPIGGRGQEGRYRIGDRFNAAGLAQRVCDLSALSGRVRFWEGDGVEWLEGLADSGVGEEVMVFVDPPYIREGNRLYANGMSAGDHERLAATLNNCPARWLLTYDDAPEVAEVLYRDRRVLAYEIGGGAARARTVAEHAVLSDNLALTCDLPTLLPGGRTWWVRQRPAAADAA